MKSKTFLFELLVDGVPYEVRATPFQFNDDIRFRVSFNGGQIFVFVYDQQLKRLTAIGEGTETIPVNLEAAISEKLENMQISKLSP
jgi:hypothetical protein